MLRLSVNAAIWWWRRCPFRHLRWLPLRMVSRIYAIYFWLTH